MNRNVFAIVFMFAAAAGTIARADKPVSKSQLPQQARTFLATHYSDRPVSCATIDSGVFETTYDVALDDGTKLEFARNGEWTEIKSPRGGHIPASAVPSKIADYVGRNYPKAKVRQMEMDGRNCEVELTNGVEITFNRQMEMIRSTDYNKHRPDHRFTLRE